MSLHGIGWEGGVQYKILMEGNITTTWCVPNRMGVTQNETCLSSANLQQRCGKISCNCTSFNRRLASGMHWTVQINSGQHMEDAATVSRIWIKQNHKIFPRNKIPEEDVSTDVLTLAQRKVK